MFRFQGFGKPLEPIRLENHRLWTNPLSIDDETQDLIGTGKREAMIDCIINSNGSRVTSKSEITHGQKSARKWEEFSYAKAARLPLLIRACTSLFRTPLR
jgi:hypothetical protein